MRPIYQRLSVPASLFGALLVCCCTAGPAAAQTTLITFDTDALGAPITAPSTFALTTALRETYAPLGVHFSGPTPDGGGAILNQGAGFGVNARSGVNFLAFSEGATLQNGGVPRPPETISFDFLVSDVSLYVSGGGNSATFTLDAFGAGNTLVTSSTVSTTAGAYSLLGVSFASGIQRVVLSETSADRGYVADDLRFTQAIPEPCTGALAAAGLLPLAGAMVRKRRRRA